jgi:hypothetical protein
MVTQARERVDLDAASDGDLRMRFGVYFYSEPAATEPTDKRRDAGRTSRAPRRREPANRNKP